MDPATVLVIRNVDMDGHARVDVRLERGRIAAIGPKLAGSDVEIDAAGGALIPGLADHHIHLFALAAQATSLDLPKVASRAEFTSRINQALAERRPGDWLRATGYHEAIVGDLARDELDSIAPYHPVRLQHRAGSLWILNSLALEAIGGSPADDCLERDSAGRPTGRIWRSDAWLRGRLGGEPPPLAPIGARLAGFGITALTDASVTTDQATADRLAEAHRRGDLPQRLTLMSAGPLEAPADGAFRVGPVKVMLDEHDLPNLTDLVGRINQARTWRRAVAVHCVTAAELALTLAAFEAAGAKRGDRIEHGGVIPGNAIRQIRARGLTVVTQPAFVHERGDRYLADVDPEEQGDLYRCASLIAGEVPTAASSDAPYATPDPWAAMAAAVDRRTGSGRALGLAERIHAARALAMYLGAPQAPGGPPRRLAIGAPADLCLLAGPLRQVLDRPRAEWVRASFISGRMIYWRAENDPKLAVNASEV